MREWLTSDLSVYEILAFQEVASAKSISRAAERLGITQPGLSRLVKKLEGQLGATLLLRTKQGTQLTKAGEKLVLESRILVRQFEQLKDSVQRQQKEIEGSYSIGAHPQVAAVTFPLVFRELLSANEKLELRPVHDLSRRIVESVISYRLDFGIVVDPIHHPDLTLILLYEDVMRFWTAKTSHENSVVIGDLHLKQTETVLAAAYKSRLLTSERIMHSSDLEVVRELTAAGVGRGIFTASVAHHLGSHSFKPLAGWPECKERIFLVFRHDFQRSRAAKAVRDHIVATLKGFKIQS